MKTPVLVFLALIVLPAIASNPGQPLDCDDWVFLEPGLSCSAVIPYPCPVIEGWPGFQTQTLCVASNDHRAMDNEGNRLWVRRIPHPVEPDCGSCMVWRTQIIRLRGAEMDVLGYLDDRCVSSEIPCQLDLLETYDQSVGDPPGSGTSDISSVVKFDPLGGQLLITFQVLGPGQYNPGLTLWAIGGFTTTFEILQTYTPAVDLSFRVPAMPEGFQHADYFDSFAGDLATLGDFTQAQPLQCGFPTTAPSVGDYITVADALPNPDPGQGRYYLTAVTHQGRRRYGRKSIDGTLSGRDPAQLPACE